MENPSDKMPWLGLLMIHARHQEKGYAIEELKKYECIMQNEGLKKVRLGEVLKETGIAHSEVLKGFSMNLEELFK